jgi:hypothetical protein
MGIGQQFAAAGTTFTTYNFEVQDFHTYFVGDDGVWVHNNPLCALGAEGEEILSLFRNLLADNPAATYNAVRSAMPTMSEAANRLFVDEVLEQIRKMKDAGTLSERRRVLGMDAATGKFKEAEVFAGVRYEAKTGHTLRRPNPNNESGDFVDSVAQWDIKGPIPSKGKFNGFLQSLVEHFVNHPAGDERIVVDVAGFSSSQVQQVKNTLSSYNSAYYFILE